MKIKGVKDEIIKVQEKITSPLKCIFIIIEKIHKNMSKTTITSKIKALILGETESITSIAGKSTK